VEYDKNADPRHREDSEDKVIISLLHCVVAVMLSLILVSFRNKGLDRNVVRRVYSILR
jgi:hypothetical protein